MKVQKLVFLIVVMIFFFFSCKKKKLNEQTVTAEDISIAENVFDDIFYVAERFDDTESVIDINDTTYKHFSYDCLTITKQYIDSATFERTITFDFGNTECKTGDGKKRLGKIIVNRVGKYRSLYSKTLITTENYSVDGYLIKGSKTITNNGLNAANEQQYLVVTSGSVITPNNEKITWNSTRIRTWVKGAETWFFGTLNTDGTIDSLYLYGVNGVYDDVWKITGAGDGINRAGRAFTVEITSGLQVQWCSSVLEITSGIIEIKPEDLKLRTVDYGNKSCDNNAVVSVGDKKYTINLSIN